MSVIATDLLSACLQIESKTKEKFTLFTNHKMNTINKVLIKYYEHQNIATRRVLGSFILAKTTSSNTLSRNNENKSPKS